MILPCLNKVYNNNNNNKSENRLYRKKCSVREMPGGQKKHPHGRKSGLGAKARSLPSPTKE